MGSEMCIRDRPKTISGSRLSYDRLVLVAGADSEPMVLDLGTAADLLLPQPSLVLVRRRIAGVLSAVLLRVSPKQRPGQVWDSICRDSAVRLQRSHSRVRAAAGAVVCVYGGTDRNGVTKSCCR